MTGPRLRAFAREGLPRLYCLLAAALLLAGCGKAPRLAPLPPGSDVLAFGNSITFGTGASPGDDYPARLAAISGWGVRNAGVPGDTADAARARIRELLAETRPALILIEIGGNDFLRRRPETLVKDDLRAIVADGKRSGAQIVVVAVPRLSLLGAAGGQLPDSPIYAEIAQEEGMLVVDGVLAAVLSDASLKADPIHPNAKGYEQLAAGIARRLHESGLLNGR